MVQDESGQPEFVGGELSVGGTEMKCGQMDNKKTKNKKTERVGQRSMFSATTISGLRLLMYQINQINNRS